MLKRFLFILLASFMVSSCLLYKESNKENIGQLKQGSKAGSEITIPDDWIFEKDLNSLSFDLQWIKELYDDELSRLVEQGLSFNADIIIAEEKLNQIELAMDIAAGNLYPTVNAIANTNNNLVSGTQIQSMGLKANWELDIWGKNKANKMASVSDYFSAKSLNDRLKQTVAGMIAKSYFLNIVGNLQEKKVEEYLNYTEEMAQIIKVKNQVGTANSLDQSNINLERITLMGYLEKIKNANLQSKRSLEILIGHYPEGRIMTKSELQGLNTKVPVALPLQLLENRPDVMARQFAIEKSFYEVQEAKAARLPSLNIGSTIGAASTNLESINSLYSNPLINVGGGLFSPLFNGGKLKKNIEIRNAQERAAVEEYSKTVLNALNEVESSWANVLSVEKQIGYAGAAIVELDKNIQLTQKQVDIGINNSFVLIQKKRDQLKREMNMIDLNLQDRIERINLYLSLGAPGFENIIN